MSKVLFLLSIVFCIFSFFTIGIKAHGLGQSFPKEVGNYIVELEYDVPEIVEGEANSFVFRILAKDGGAPVSFDSTLVRFEKKTDSSTYLVTRLSEDEIQEGVSRMTTVLDSGDYLISLSFKKGDEKLGETTYDLNVRPVDKKEFPLAAVLSFLGGSGVGFLICKRISRS